MRYGSRARPSRRERGGEGESAEVEVPTGPEEIKEEVQEGELHVWVYCICAENLSKCCSLL